MKTELKEGMFVRWASLDETKSTIKFDGRIASIGNNIVVLVTDHGIMGIPVDDGTFEPIRKPKNFQDVKIVKEVPAKKPATSIVRTPRESNGVSKKDRAFQSYRDLKCLLAQDGMEPTRKVVVDMFVRDLGMTPAGASTYASMVMRLGASAKG